MGSDAKLWFNCNPESPFQSTLPHGERLAIRNGRRGYGIISIHAPAWGATQKGPMFGSKLVNFNPRSRMGSDLRTLTCGSLGTKYFNPRSRMGSDSKNIQIHLHNIMIITKSAQKVNSIVMKQFVLATFLIER